MAVTFSAPTDPVLYTVAVMTIGSTTLTSKSLTSETSSSPVDVALTLTVMVWASPGIVIVRLNTPLAEVPLEGETIEEMTYEGYGPGGVAIMVQVATDNKNRTTPEIKHLFSKLGFEVAAPGAASWAFTKVGSKYIPNEPLTEIEGDDEEKLTTLLETLDEHEDVQQIFTNARGYESNDDENTGD